MLKLIEAAGVEVRCSRSGLAVDASPRRDKLIFELMRRRQHILVWARTAEKSLF
jgi:hypothetical protein